MLIHLVHLSSFVVVALLVVVVVSMVAGVGVLLQAPLKLVCYELMRNAYKRWQWKFEKLKTGWGSTKIQKIDTKMAK